MITDHNDIISQLGATYSQSVYKVPQTLLTVQCTVSHYTRHHKLRAGGAVPPRPVGEQASSGPRRMVGWAARLEQWQRGLFQKYCFVKYLWVSLELPLPKRRRIATKKSGSTDKPLSGRPRREPKLCCNV